MASKTIKSMLHDINNEDADGGGIWLPNIQRLFVWNEEQIERLFDSVMRLYPIQSMMIWKTKEEIRNRQFIKQYFQNIDLKTLYRNVNPRVKRLVLDGQQRLQSLYIGLKGSYQGKELYINILSGETIAPKDIKYDFKFLDPKTTQWPWVKFSSLIYTTKIPGEILGEYIDKNKITISPADKAKAERNMGIAQQRFSINDSIIYQEIDGTSEDVAYPFEDIVEIFIRANSGGTKLSKSDLMFTLITSEWGDADIEMQTLLSDLNGQSQFDFDRDFVLKAVITALDLGAEYSVEKLRNEKVKKNVSAKFGKVSESIQFVRDFLVQKTFIRNDKSLTSYNAIIPLVYLHYNFKDTWGNGKPLREYLLKTLLCSAFSGRPDNLIDKLTSSIKTKQSFVKQQIFKAIQEDGRNLTLTDDMLFRNGYTSANIHLIFNLWYPTADYQPLYDGHLPQIDHIFPQSELKKIKEVNEETGRGRQVYSAADINQIANCMLLTAKENGSGEKSNILPEVWFSDKDDEYLSLHCIPKQKKFWKIENYEKFIEERKNLIRIKMIDLGIMSE